MVSMYNMSNANWRKEGKKKEKSKKEMVSIPSYAYMSMKRSVKKGGVEEGRKKSKSICNLDVEAADGLLELLRL
jgi:hypothetical protein